MSKETTSKKKTKRRLASFFGKIVIYILILILYDKGVIENKFSFKIQAKFFEIRMHAGDYTFNTSQTTRQMLEMIDDGVLENNVNDNKS